MKARIMQNNRGFGFSLVEVLVAVVVTSVGIVGVLQFQKYFIKSGDLANGHLIATQLVREKVDDLTDINDFTALIAGADGAAIIRSNYSFTRQWTMVNNYYDQGDAIWKGLSAGQQTEQKVTAVSVSWTDSNGQQQTVTQNQVFSAVSAHDSRGAINTVGAKSVPKVPAITAPTPQNPAISLTDDSFAQTPSAINAKQSLQANPSIYSFEDSNYVQFDTIIYDHKSNTQSLEDFVTLNCSCRFNGKGEGMTPTTMRISDAGDSLVNDQNSGYILSKHKGAASATQQPPLCNKCCENHHDMDASTAKYVAGSNSGNHHHFNATLVKAMSGSYLEACRLRRVDGFYQLVPDWQLLDLVIMPQSYFTFESNVTAYVAYVKNVVKAYLKKTTAPDKRLLPSRDLANMAAGHQQLHSRGIYVDIASLNASDRVTLLAYVDSRVDWLKLVPFYEVNLSLFSEWQSTNSSIASVTNEAINTRVDVSVDHYGTYSRGRIFGSASSGEGIITATSRIDNTGITGSGAITPSTGVLSDQIIVSVSASSNNDNSVFVTINCLIDTETACNNKDTEDLVVTIIPNTISCAYSPKKGAQTASLSCNGVADWLGIIRFSKTGYTFDLASAVFNLSDNTKEERSITMSKNAAPVLVKH